MNVTITCTPTDSNGHAFRLPGVYTLTDLQTLANDLAAALEGAGVAADAALQFSITPAGSPQANQLTIQVQKNG